ncbi:T5orf172 domain-containing protein [Lophiotrema nucula]|uniref:T5orf172 domain-containing protein n=1 Tax=Lophiotrema nucula TaxID=690887 RepID=A0A6A5YGP4_9PLEO|nr:T5orf172 domain-containing protein [Lophiotrema nucula]
MSLLPVPDLSKLERIADLFKFRDDLLNNHSKAQFPCLFYYSSGHYCDKNCKDYADDHPGTFKSAGRQLVREVDEVEKEHFIAVVRTFFCGDHDLTKLTGRRRPYKQHFEALWESASREVKSDVWDALRKSGRNIYPPLTPVRPRRPKATQIHSAPVGAFQEKLKTSSNNASSPLTLGSDTPSRPRTAQATLGQSDNPTADGTPVATPTPAFPHHPTTPENDMYASTFSPSLLPACRILRPHFGRPGVDQPLETSSQVTTHSMLDKIKSIETIHSPHLKQEHSLPVTGNPNWLHKLCNSETIFEKLEKGAKRSTPDNVENVEYSKGTPIYVPQAGHCIEEPVTESPQDSSELEEIECVLRPKPSMRSENGGPDTEPDSHSTPGDHPSKSAHLPKPESAAFETDVPLPSGTSSPNHEPSSAKCGKAAAPPAHPTTTKPCEYEIYGPNIIANTVRNILKKPVEVRTGAIYVFEAPEFFKAFQPARDRNEQWVKIGISSDVRKRIKNLRFRCGITDLQCFYVSDSGTMRMDLLRRIETLCHEELNNFRRRMKCKDGLNRQVKCNTVHEEWFAVDKEVAKRTVERWWKFLKSDPYGESGYLNGDWVARLEHDFGSFEASEGSMDAWVEASLRTIMGKKGV